MTHNDEIEPRRDSRWEAWGSDHELVLTIPNPGSCYVYVAWGIGPRPLYVGKARNPYARISTHMRQKPWATEVLRWECHGFPNEPMAVDAEIEAIHDLNPIHNVQRRLTQAEWEAIRQQAAEKEARREARMAEIAARYQARQDRRPKPAPVVKAQVSPHKRRRLRTVKWRDDLFTPDQLAIIARVQNRGRAA
jgi:hypothetical protein